MPIDISLYPDNWSSLALEVKEAAIAGAIRRSNGTSDCRRQSALSVLREEMLQARGATRGIITF